MGGSIGPNSGSPDSGVGGVAAGGVWLLAGWVGARVRETGTGRDQSSWCLKPSTLGGPAPVRVTTAFNRLLRLEGVNVTDVVFGMSTITVTVGLRRRRLLCPHCGHATGSRYDTRPCPSAWRHLDLGVWRVHVQATLRRLSCPTHGVVVEAVPFASRART